MRPEQPRPSLARLGDNKFASLVRQFMSPANPRWNLPQEKGGYAHNTKDSWSRALQFAIRPDCLGDVSLQEIRPSPVQAFFDGIADRPGKQKVTLTALKQIEAWAIVRELLPRQITFGVKISKSTGGPVPKTTEWPSLEEGRSNRPRRKSTRQASRASWTRASRTARSCMLPTTSRWSIWCSDIRHGRHVGADG